MSSLWKPKITMNTYPANPLPQHPVTALPALRLIRPAIAAILLLGLPSCIQPPPPRTYSPQTARHLRSLSHDAPVTPMPSAYCGWGYYSYAPYYRTCY